jgi:integral membrane sensor domain MASE1
LARALKYLVLLSAVGAVYFLLARFGRELVSVYPGATVISPPAGFALAAVLLGGYRVVPAIFAAVYAANAASLELDYASAAIAAGPALEAFVGGVLVNWCAGGLNAFAAPTGVAKFVVIAVIAAAVGASVSSGVDLGIGVSVSVEQVEW